MKRVLTVGITYTGEEIEGVEIENLGLCQPAVDQARAAFPLYEYDTIIIDPQSYSHFLFGTAGEFSDEPYELGKLKDQNDRYDIDSAFDQADRQKEMEAALAAGTSVVWCLSEPKRVNFYGYRETHLGYAAPKIAALVKRSDLLVKKGRRMGQIDQDSPFVCYFEVLSHTGWTLCLSAPDEGYVSIASTPEGYSLGGRVSLGPTAGWVLTPPTSQDAVNQLVRDSLALEKADQAQEKYHGIFLSHTGIDKPFVRRLRDDLLAHGVPRVWLDEAEIEIGDSLIAKIDEGMKLSRYIAVVLSTKSIDAPWVKKELDVAMNREIATGQVVVLPLLYEPCELPEFLRGKLYADFSKPEEYEEVLAKLLRRLRITG
ncbi:toll/interleukin-1 receptor domain-containing protein [Phenylobacterium sp.]|uniref:toll/interleukin-1 receptor domain-containing protein n=1 Tax=Phenylobacterium sp. TaxID=1871053 RepID=UPI0027355C16|nr:toll/interleukin-1 receptor domain-containing protein [Phenylobacterium sp.]MDP3635150.1 toll/interleukin-1 receptor domain-containing protein [Phenylobacterium sp.]